MTNYQTKQRKLLLEHLMRNPQTAFSAAQLAASLQDISVSAIYRNLATLEAQGHAKRVTRTGSREAFFQYQSAQEAEHRLHLSCEKCGRVYPVETEGAEQLLQSIIPTQRFAVDPASTVLYGICAACQDEEEEDGQ